MRLSTFIATSAFASAILVFGSAMAQNKALNIGPGNIGPGQPCTPGFTCNQPPPPPPNFGNQPQCFPPNTLVQIRTLFGTRYECRAPVYVQPAPQPVPQPIPQPFPQTVPQGQQGLQGQYSQAHYAWCAQKYKSYKPATNSFTAYSGETRYCSSPYN